MSDKPTFTENDMRIMSNAMLCLKSGMPEVDQQKLAGFLGMSNPKSAANAWSAVKKKILAASTSEDGITLPTATTPKKGRAAAKEKDADKDKGGNEDDDSDGKPKTPKKTSPKKRASKGGDGEASPKKKSKKADEEAMDSGVEDAINSIKAESEKVGEKVAVEGPAAADVV